MGAPDPTEVAQVIVQACLEELDAPKPGNVHKFRDGHAMAWQDFQISAETIAPILTDRGQSVGPRILHAVQATLARTHCNTNLGIILLAAPLAEAVMLTPGGALPKQLKQVLDSLTPEDTQAVFQAIALASPGGLGERADHDVRRPPTLSLIEAMALAASADFIARQYVTGFADVLGFGVRRVRFAQARWPLCPWAPALWTYLGFMARKADSHIHRKYGEDRVSEVMALGRKLERALRHCEQPQTLLPMLLAADNLLKSQNINPGTSADLTVASLLATRLIAIMRAEAKP